MTITQIPDVLTAFRDLLAESGLEVYEYVPDNPSLPAIVVYVESWPYDPTAQMTVVLWCLAGNVEEQGAQAQLMQWLSDEGDGSLVALIDANHNLGGVVSSALPVETRNWGITALLNGTRVLQAELVVNILK